MNARTIILGVIVLIVGLVLTTVVSDQTSTIGGSASLGSFAGASALLDLVPLVYVGASALLDLVPLVYVASVVLIAAQLLSSGAGFGGLGGVARKVKSKVTKSDF